MSDYIDTNFIIGFGSGILCCGLTRRLYTLAKKPRFFNPTRRFNQVQSGFMNTQSGTTMVNGRIVSGDLTIYPFFNYRTFSGKAPYFSGEMKRKP